MSNTRWVSTNIDFQGFSTTQQAIWVFDPRCDAGPCDGRLKRTGKNGWESRYLYLNPLGRYRWLRRNSGAFTCGDIDIPGNLEYLIRPMKVRLGEDGLTWIVSKFEGTLYEQALETGGCFRSVRQDGSFEASLPSSGVAPLLRRAADRRGGGQGRPGDAGWDAAGGRPALGSDLTGPDIVLGTGKARVGPDAPREQVYQGCIDLALGQEVVPGAGE